MGPCYEIQAFQCRLFGGKMASRFHRSDIRSAKEHKLQVVAVATGPYSAAELRGLDPDLLINDCEFGWASLVAFLDSLHV